MYRLIFIFASLLTIGVVVESEFPNDPKPCKYEDSECIVKYINYLTKEKFEGESSLNLIKLDPLSIPQMSIKQGEESPVNIDLNFKNNTINGIRNSGVYKVKGFGKDITKKKEFRTKIPLISLVGPYTIKGKVLILPISGSGTSNITLVNTDFKFTFTGIPEEKNGNTYMKVNNLRLDFEPERVYYEFSNLFNGDKALGDNMNLFLNENWREILNEVKASITVALGQIFQDAINNVFEKYPYEKYFAE